MKPGMWNLQTRSEDQDQYSAVAASINSKIDLVPRSPSSIYKVPNYIRSVNKECYEPSMISIGPFYYKSTSLNHSQEIKIRDFQIFLELIREYNCGLQELFDVIKGLEEKTRSYYQNNIDLSSNEFIEMVMIDAAFIISSFLHLGKETPGITEISILNYLISKQGVVSNIVRDLFLVENQLPFFVLNDLYNTIHGAAYPENSFIDVTCNFIDDIICLSMKKAPDNLRRLKETNIEHLVHFLRIYHLPTKRREPGVTYNVTEIIKFPITAKELKATGVNFVASESKNLLDITYSKGELKIPTLHILDITEAIFRNIIFFEQCHYHFDSYFIDYLKFFDDLIDSPEDVQILVKSKIIEHWLGTDEEVAAAINSIVKHILINPRNFYYNDVCHELDAYASKKHNKWKAILRREYFNHPWSIISVIYLVILLILTVLQVYTGFKK